MEETTVLTEEESLIPEVDLDSVMGTLTDVFGFFQKIIDFLKGFLTPIFEDLIRSLLG